MKALIDTSSLISLVRYYLPFDIEGKLSGFIKEQVKSGNIIVLDKVAEECKFQSQGLVIHKLPFVNERKYKTTTTTIIPDKRFYNLIDNNFVLGSSKNQLTNAEYLSQKDSYLKSADCSLILYAYMNKADDVFIITEETEFSNDGKTFKKIPQNCKQINVQTKSLPAFLQENEIISISVETVSTSLFGE